MRAEPLEERLRRGPIPLRDGAEGGSCLAIPCLLGVSRILLQLLLPLQQIAN
jgi:hypothetical protein